MGDLSKRFSRSEFACPCGCNMKAVDYELITELESLADYFEKLEPTCSRVAVHINSGNRCETYDKAMKIKNGYEVKAKPSEHLFNWATDFRMEYVYPETNQRTRISDDLIADTLEDRHLNEHGIGRYIGRTHYDTRMNGPARWDNRSK